MQGFGNVGSNAAELLAADGYRVIGVDEYDGGILNPKGLDIEALLAYRAKHQTVAGLPRRPGHHPPRPAHRRLRHPGPRRHRKPDHQPQRRPDPGAHHRARAPTAPPPSEADEILEKKGVFVVPDILANAGGVTVSYFEWVQDRQGYFWKEAEVNHKLQDIMDSSFAAVVGYADKHQVNNRIAAYMLAIDRVATAIQLRGIYA